MADCYRHGFFATISLSDNLFAPENKNVSAQRYSTLRVMFYVVRRLARRMVH